MQLLLELTDISCQIETRKIDWSVQSKVGSLENAGHSPGGGDKKVIGEIMVVSGSKHKLDIN